MPLFFLNFPHSGAPVFLPGGDTAPDVPLGLVDVQDLFDL